MCFKNKSKKYLHFVFFLKKISNFLKNIKKIFDNKNFISVADISSKVPDLMPIKDKIFQIYTL